VRGISNQLKVNSPVPVTVVEEEIERALERLEQMDAQRVSIQVTGNRVMLRGEVKTWREHEAAAQAAASIAGVKDVKNEIRVAPWMF
jgi:osmotically-inducible protein OsmY